MGVEGGPDSDICQVCDLSAAFKHKKENREMFDLPFFMTMNSLPGCLCLWCKCYLTAMLCDLKHWLFIFRFILCMSPVFSMVR